MCWEKILKIGIGVNHIKNKVESKRFPKFKDVLVEIPIDDSVKPVSQSYRRIPIPLEGKVKEKVKELLVCDIIEEVKGPSRWVSFIKTMSILSIYNRNNRDAHVHQIIEYSKPVPIPMSDIMKFSQNDSETQKVRDSIYKNTWDPLIKNYKIFENELCFYEDILLRGNKIVIPQKLRKAVIDAAHEGHPGIVAMKGRLRTKVWWLRIDKDVEDLIKGCRGCTLVSLPNPPAPMKRRELPKAPWLDVAIDLLGPLPTGEYSFVIVDYYSRYKEVKIMKIITSSQIIQVLKEIFSQLGYPVSMTADNGRQFVSGEFKSFCRQCGIKLFNTVLY